MTAIFQGHGRRAVLVVSALCALVVTGTGLTGCGSGPDEGTNGVSKLPPAKIQSRTRTAAASVDTVRLAGTVVASGSTYTLDMRLKSDGGTGSVTSEGTTFQVLRIDDQLYLKADAEFWSHEDGEAEGGGTDTAAADKLDGKYVKVPKDDPAYKKFSGFTDKDVLLDSLLTLHGKLGTGGHHEQSGVPTIRITGDDGSGGTLDVSLDGKPYPLRLERAGGAGTLTFSDWGKDFTVKEPAKDDTVDYGQQLPTS